jgi:hypothetical protein
MGRTFTKYPSSYVRANQMASLRQIVFRNGTGPRNYTLVYETNAPKLVLSDIERDMNDGAFDCPSLEDCLQSQGYICKLIDSMANGNHSDAQYWLAENYPDVKEIYTAWGAF